MFKILDIFYVQGLDLDIKKDERSKESTTYRFVITHITKLAQC